jgi:hypothetical protein
VAAWKKEQEQEMSKQKHPYKQYESDPIWRVVDQAVRALAKNGDIQETTERQYIVGFLCEKLSQSDLLAPKVISHQRRSIPATAHSNVRASA